MPTFGTRRAILTNLQADALLARYAIGANGAPLPHSADCFQLLIDDDVRFAEFIRAFYNSPLFRCERIILALAGLRSKRIHSRVLLRAAYRHLTHRRAMREI